MLEFHSTCSGSHSGGARGQVLRSRSMRTSTAATELRKVQSSSGKAKSASPPSMALHGVSALHSKGIENGLVFRFEFYEFWALFSCFTIFHSFRKTRWLCCCFLALAFYKVAWLKWLQSLCSAFLHWVFGCGDCFNWTEPSTDTHTNIYIHTSGWYKMTPRNEQTCHMLVLSLWLLVHYWEPQLHPLIRKNPRRFGAFPHGHVIPNVVEWRSVPCPTDCDMKIYMPVSIYVHVAS